MKNLIMKATCPQNIRARMQYYNVMYVRTTYSEGKKNYVSVLYKFYSKQQVVLYIQAI